MATEDIFIVNSSANVGITEYYLDSNQWHHILLGHRSMLNQSSAIRFAVESPTHIYKSTQPIFATRLIFVSQKVLTGNGHPMKVVIERDGMRGKVITAMWSRPPSVGLVWDSNGSVISSYDEDSDIFYISHAAHRDEYAVDDEELDGVWLRLSEETDSPQGVTVFGLKQFPDIEKLIDKIALFLGATKSEISTRVRSAVER